MPVSSSIYQFLNPGAVAQPDGLGSFRQGYTIGSDLEQQRQNSLLGQMRLAELQRQQQVEDQFRARLRQEYATGGTAGAPGLAGLAPAGVPGAVPPVQEVVNTPYGPDLQAMLSQYQQEGAPVTPTPGARTVPPAPMGAAGAPAPAAAPGSAPYGDTGALNAAGSRPASTLLRDLGMIDPMAARKYEKEEIDREKSRFDLLEKQNDLVASTARSILQDDTQAGYERGVAYLRSVGIPVDHLPRYYDRKMVEQYAAWSTDTKSQLARQRLALDTISEERLREGEKRQQQEYELDVEKFGVTKAKALREEREAASAVPKYTSDSTLNVAIDQEMQAAGLAAGSKPPGAILEKAMQRVQEGKVQVSRATGEAAAVAKPLEGPALQRVNMLMQGEDVAKALQTEFTPEERRKYVGMGGLRMSAQEAQQLLADATGGKADPKFARFAALVALAKQEAFSTAGQALSMQERDVVFGYIPTGKEWSAEEFEQKLTLSGQRLPTLIDRELTLSTTPREQLAERRKRGELPSLSPGSPTQAAPATAQKVLTEAHIEATLAEEKARGRPKTRQQVIDAARNKGWKVPEK